MKKKVYFCLQNSFMKTMLNDKSQIIFVRSLEENLPLFCSSRIPCHNTEQRSLDPTKIWHLCPGSELNKKLGLCRLQQIFLPLNLVELQSSPAFSPQLICHFLRKIFHTEPICFTNHFKLLPPGKLTIFVRHVLAFRGKWRKFLHSQYTNI